MNTSINNSDMIISLMNKLYDLLKSKNLKNLDEFVNEKFLKELLLEIEPKLEKLGAKIEINEDTNFGIRYANFVSILNCLEKYLQKSPDKERFSPATDLKNLIIINDLLKCDKEQMVILAEVIIFLSSISSRKDYYLDKISEFDDIRYVNAFFAHVEKYIVLDNKFDETNQSHLDRSYMVNTQINKLREEYERERENLYKTIKDNEKEISKLFQKNEVLEKNYQDLETKYKDKERELEIVKSTQTQNMKFHEELFKDNIANSELMSKLNQKELELSDLKRENEAYVKRMNEEIKKLRDKMDAYEDRMQDYKSIKSQNDKLNSKIKELSITKERHQEYDEMRKTLEIKNKQIETLLKEKQTFASQIDKLNKELLVEKEKFHKVDFEKKKMEYDLNEAKKDVSRLEVNSKNLQNMHMNLNNISEVRKGPPQLNQSELGADDIKLFDLGGDSIIFDDIKDTKRNMYTEKEIQELRNEKNELAKLYKGQIDEIHKLIDEKDKLLNTIDSYRLEIDKHNSEKERLGIEKEKLEIQIQKSDLDVQKLQIHIERYENEKKRMEEEIKDLNEKIENLTSEKSFKNKEYEQLKQTANSNKLLADKLLSEKQQLISDYHNLQIEFEKFKNIPSETINLTGSSNLKNKSKVSPKSASNVQLAEALSENSLLRNEIQTLKLNISQKEEIIKNLRDKIRSIEDTNDTTEKISQDLVKRSEDLEFYKRSYEEQKNRVNREHELISTSLYELALQFMSLKSELQKKMNPHDNTYSVKK